MGSSPVSCTFCRIGVDYMNKLDWCRANAPEAMLVCDDSELLQLMSGAYEILAHLRKEFESGTLSNYADYKRRLEECKQSKM